MAQSRDQQFDPKISGLLSLEARLLEYSGNYKPYEYLHFVISQIEEIKKASKPWQLLDDQEYQAYQSLVLDHLGGDRRSGQERRVPGSAPLGSGTPRLQEERRRKI